MIKKHPVGTNYIDRLKFHIIIMIKVIIQILLQKKNKEVIFQSLRRKKVIWVENKFVLKLKNTLN